MKSFFGGQWVAGAEVTEVVNPYTGEAFETVPKGTAADVARAIDTLEQGKDVMRRMPAHRRSSILRGAVAGMERRSDELARTICQEAGKPISEARSEVARAMETMSLSADEAKRLTGESFSLDAAPNGEGKIGWTLRVPCGIVAAISPFNFPLNLVCHKIGPAIAGGNAVLLKPATDTPLSGLKMLEILLEAGLPEEAIACVTGSGKELGEAICTDDRVRKISFTGSDAVGREICHMAGVKRVTMELGSNCAVIVMDDADLELASAAIRKSGYANAGQVCISTQRVYASERIQADFLDALRQEVERIVVGDPADDSTVMGPLIRESDAERVAEWIDEAIAGGARQIVGGKRSGSMYPPTVIEGATPGMRVLCEELFGPAVVVSACSSIEEAIALANDTRYGLAAGIFTRDIDRAMRFAREVDAGNLNINGSSQYRADLMPYGGLKESGMGKEGPKYAIREMTEEKMVVWHG